MKNRSAVYSMTSCALMAALMCALCPLSIPIGPIPISMGVFVMLLSAYLLGTRRAMLSCAVYLLLGAMGMPVFSGFQGGIARLAGPTGGYLAGFLPMILIAGMIAEKGNRRLPISMLGMLLGIAADYLLGTAWFILQTGSELPHALAVCVFPFIPADLGKLAAAALLGRALREAMVRAGVGDIPN